MRYVQSKMHFLLNFLGLRKDIIVVIKVPYLDSEESVHYEVVIFIVETAKHDFRIDSESEDLLSFVKEHTPD